MNIAIIIAITVTAIILAVRESVKWHISELVKNGEYEKARRWAVFLGKKWEHRVRYEYYSRIENTTYAELLLRALYQETKDNDLKNLIDERLPASQEK